MAEQNLSQKLEEQLTCPVCLDHYDNPKTLPCLHSFCLKCIQQLPVDPDKGKYQIRCPACRRTVTLTDNGVTDLPSSFVINNLLEIQELIKKVSVSEGQQICCGNCQATNATRYCKECATVYCEECLVHHNKLKVNITHSITDVKDVASNVHSMKQEVIMNCTDHNKPLEIFCETCKDLICQSCTVRRHRDHDYDIATDVFPKHRQEIEASLQIVKLKIAATSDAFRALSKREKEIIKQGEDTSKEIHQYAQQIIESVQQCEGLLVKQVDASVQYKLKLLGEQVKEAETALKQLKSCEEYIEQSLEVGSPQQILSEKQRMIQGMEVASKQINPEVFQPVEEADITFTSNKALVDSCKDIGEVKHRLQLSNKHLLPYRRQGNIKKTEVATGESGVHVHPVVEEPKILCTIIGCSFYGKEELNGFCHNCHKEYVIKKRPKPKLEERKILCKVVGCGFYGKEELNGFCNNHKEYERDSTMWFTMKKYM